jgi:hypothetical protein
MPMRVITTASIAFGLAAGSYGIASAASKQGTTTAAVTTTAAAPSAPDQDRPWGGRRSDETVLTGDAEAKVRAAALGAVSGGTVVRVETDADGHAMYEAHMTKSDGTPVTAYVDASFAVVGVESR